MALDLDVLGVIGQYCDPKTRFSLALSNRDVHKRELSHFVDMETDYVCLRLKSLVNDIDKERSHHMRVRKAHKLMKEVIRFSHQIKLLPRIREAFMNRLDIWQYSGMNKAKAREYMRILNNL